jgi:hypothetical protein
MSDDRHADCRMDNAVERAQLGYDDAHERALIDAIIEAITRTSLISGEPPVLCLRTGEIANALTKFLVLILAMSPSAVRSPAAICKLADEFHRRLVKRVADAALDPELNDFVARAFRDDDRERGGRA